MTAVSVDEAERRYNARLAVPHWPEIFDRWASESAHVRAHARCRLDLRYGPHALQTLDLFLPEGPARGTLIYVHGGYWRSLDKSDASVVAPPFVAAGYAVAVINYALCPEVSVETIVEQVRQAALWTHRHRTGWQPPEAGLYACGHSAGGHLAALLLATGWPALLPDGPRKLIRAAVCVSALYDLRPLCDVPSVTQATGFTRDRVAAISPALLRPTTDAPLLTALGLAENPGVHDQAHLMAERWTDVHAGHVACAGHDHFSILDELTHEDGAIATRALDLMRSLDKTYIS